MNAPSAAVKVYVSLARFPNLTVTLLPSTTGSPSTGTTTFVFMPLRLIFDASERVMAVTSGNVTTMLSRASTTPVSDAGFTVTSYFVIIFGASASAKKNAPERFSKKYGEVSPSAILP